MPVGSIREGLTNEPTLNRVNALGTTRQLLDGPGLEGIYQQFTVLSQAVGVDAQDLMVPAVVWITYLLKYNDAGERDQ
jgi:hypothetical protein